MAFSPNKAAAGIRTLSNRPDISGNTSGPMTAKAPKNQRRAESGKKNNLNNGNQAFFTRRALRFNEKRVFKTQCGEHRPEIDHSQPQGKIAELRRTYGHRQKYIA